MTELATDFQTNLKPIYAILSNVLHGFAPKLPGPKPAEASHLRQRIATLEATNRVLEQGEDAITALFAAVCRNHTSAAGAPIINRDCRDASL